MKLIILDRDGVINYDSDDYIKTVDEWQALPGSIEAMARLYHHGYTISVVTNQSGIGRGYYTHETLAAMHRKMQSLMAEHDAKVDTIFYCPHQPEEGCRCRKPKNGMYEQIEEHYGISVRGCYTIGDTLRDLQAGIASGAKPILVRTGKGERTLLEHKKELEGVPVFADLSDAVDAILSNGL